MIKSSLTKYKDVFLNAIKELRFTYVLMIPLLFMTYILGEPYFNLKFAISFLSFPIICLLIALPTISLLKPSKVSLDENKPNPELKVDSDFILNRFNKID